MVAIAIYDNVLQFVRVGRRNLYVLSPIHTLNVCKRLSSKLLRVFRLIDRVKKGLHSNNLPRDPSILLLSAGRHKSFTNRASWKPQQQSLRFYNQQQVRYGLYLGPFCSESLPQPVFQNRGNCNRRHRFCLERRPPAASAMPKTVGGIAIAQNV